MHTDRNPITFNCMGFERRHHQVLIKSNTELFRDEIDQKERRMTAITSTGLVILFVIIIPSTVPRENIVILTPVVVLPGDSCSVILRNKC